MLKTVVKFLVVCHSLTFITNHVAAAPSDSVQLADSVWIKLVDQIRDPEFDTLAIKLEDYDLTHVDFKLHIKSGKLYLFKPLQLDNGPVYYGGFFAGKGKLSFAPSIRTEKDQIQRFFDSDSLINKANQVLLYFSDSIYKALAQNGKLIKAKLPRKSRKLFKDGLQLNSHFSDYYTSFMVLKNNLFRQPESFLVVQAIENRLNQIIYAYDPLDREEITFYKVYPNSQGAESVCSYH